MPCFEAETTAALPRRQDVLRQVCRGISAYLILVMYDPSDFR